MLGHLHGAGAVVAHFGFEVADVAFRVKGVRRDCEDRILHGKIEGISDFVNFECSKVEDIEAEFHKAADDYLEFCREAEPAENISEECLPYLLTFGPD